MGQRSTSDRRVWFTPCQKRLLWMIPEPHSKSCSIPMIASKSVKTYLLAECLEANVFIESDFGGCTFCMIRSAGRTSLGRRRPVIGSLGNSIPCAGGALSTARPSSIALSKNTLTFCVLAMNRPSPRSLVCQPVLVTPFICFRRLNLLPSTMGLMPCQRWPPCSLVAECRMFCKRSVFFVLSMVRMGKDC